MPFRRWPRRGAVRPNVSRAARMTMFLSILALVIAATVTMSAALRNMVTEYAASAARDEVVTTVNEIVKEVMADAQQRGESLVELERDQAGCITAINANVVAINTLAAEVLSRSVTETSHAPLTVNIPLVNLLGSAILMNHGPSIQVHVTMLSSSSASFRSEISSAGINQTRHQLFLDLNVELAFLLPWRGINTSVETEILVSETVVVGQVPYSYMNWER